MKKIDFNTEDYDSLKISELKRMADFWLRQYLLKMAKRKGVSGYIFCPIKNSWYPEYKMQVAHYIDRACMNLRYDLKNVKLISEQSNSWDSQIPKEGYKSKHHKEYSLILKKKDKQYLLDNNIIRIFARQDYIDAIEKFKNGR